MLQLTRKENRELNLYEYRRGYVALKSRPRFIIVELTQGCNLKCPMCRPQIISTKEANMSDLLFQRVADEFFPTAEMVDLRGWGESLILPNICQRIDAVVQYGASVRFVTNLSFRRNDILEALAEHRCHVAVSVDTTDPDLFSVLRGGANFQRVSANLSYLVQAYVRRYRSTYPICITVTVQRPALRDLHHLVDFAADKGVKEVRISSVTTAFQSLLSVKGYEALVQKAINQMTKRAEKRGVTLIATTCLGSLSENQADIPPCLHPWCYCYIAYDGSVGFCDHLIGEDGKPYLMGSLTASTFEELWNGTAWQTLRREHLTSRNPEADLFKECGWCYKKRYIEFEQFFDPSASERRIILTTANRSL